METAHRLPRFFVLWWTAVPVLALPLGVAVGAQLIESFSHGLNAEDHPILYVLLPVEIAVVLVSLIGGHIVIPFAVTLGLGQLWLLRNVWPMEWSTGRTAMCASAGVSMVAGFIGAFVSAIPLQLVIPLTSHTSQTIYAYAVALVGGAVLGAMLGFTQKAQFRVPPLLPSNWWALSAAGWSPYGLAVAASFALDPRVHAVASVASEAGTVALGVFGLLSPGLVTGLALKRIVEAAPAPPEPAPAAADIEA